MILITIFTSGEIAGPEYNQQAHDFLDRNWVEEVVVWNCRPTRWAYTPKEEGYPWSS